MTQDDKTGKQLVKTQSISEYDRKQHAGMLQDRNEA